jgi:DNA-nicking Smr family endonuclease
MSGPGGRDEPSDEFADALGDVKPLDDRSRNVRPASGRPRSGPPAEGAVDPFAHPEAGELRFAHRRSAKPRTVERLRSGALAHERRLDLHHMRAAPAEQALARAVEAATRAGESVLLVVHGRGRHTGGVSMLREALPEWLEANDRVLAYAPAPGPDGGAGATLVLIRSR